MTDIVCRSLSPTSAIIDLGDDLRPCLAHPVVSGRELEEFDDVAGRVQEQDL